MLLKRLNVLYKISVFVTSSFMVMGTVKVSMQLKIARGKNCKTGVHRTFPKACRQQIEKAKETG